jgi:hypothetical protein
MWSARQLRSFDGLITRTLRQSRVRRTSSALDTLPKIMNMRAEWLLIEQQLE